MYRYIENNWEFFKHTDHNWKNSIRHNLSLNTIFKKIPRNANDVGKGSYWGLVESKIDVSNSAESSVAQTEEQEKPGDQRLSELRKSFL